MAVEDSSPVGVPTVDGDPLVLTPTCTRDVPSANADTATTTTATMTTTLAVTGGNTGSSSAEAAAL